MESGKTEIVQRSSNLDFIPSGVQARLLGEVLVELSADQTVVGVLLAGSFARGDAYPLSDLDVYVLLQAGDTRPFSATIREGILVEISYMDAEAAKAKMVRNPISLYTYLEGRILYDPKGQLAALHAFAREQMATYRVSEKEAAGIAHWLRSACVKIEAARQTSDNLKTAYLVATNSFELLVGMWAINQKPMPSGGGVLAHLKDLTRQPEHIPDWIRALFQGDAQERMQTFLAVCEWAIPLLEAPASPVS